MIFCYSHVNKIDFFLGLHFFKSVDWQENQNIKKKNSFLNAAPIDDYGRVWHGNFGSV